VYTQTLESNAQPEHVGIVALLEAPERSPAAGSMMKPVDKLYIRPRRRRKRDLWTEVEKRAGVTAPFQLALDFNPKWSLDDANTGGDRRTNDDGTQLKTGMPELRPNPSLE
jgi:hypothetical protein